MKHIFIFILLCLFAEMATAQRSIAGTFEGGIMLGATNYSGDVAEKAIELNETQPGYGVFIRYHINKKFSLRTHLYSGSISGDDKNTVNFSRKYRFGTSIFEGGLVAEWSPFARENLTSTGIEINHFEPYVFGGLGFTLADAKAEYYGTTPNTDLRVPLPEDGLRTSFLLAPVGVGIRYNVLERLVIGLEGGFRPVFSDDLDGMRINGNPGSNDWYYFGGVTVSFVIGGDSF